MVDSNICLKTPLGEVFLSSEWSSVQEEYRKKIRTELYKKTKDASFLDLEKIPESDKFFVSISHCKSLGGYALHLKKDIGFDVEEVNRIQPEVIERISTDKDREIFKGENSKFLWVIKEAAFKMTSGRSDVMTEVEIETLDKVGERSYLGTLSVKGVKADFLCGEVGEGCIFSLVKSGN